MKTKDFLERQTDTIVEYRTTLYPPILSSSRLKNMAQFVPSNAQWALQTFVAKTAWDKTARDAIPYINAEIQTLITELKEVTGKNYIFFR
jgi:hypothetical protein